MLRSLHLRTGLFRIIRFLDSVTFRRKAREPGSIRRVIFLKYETALGTAVNTTPVFELVKRLRPDIHITVACSSTAYEILKYCPYVDELLLTENPSRSFLRAAYQLWSHALKNGWIFDCALTDVGNQKARIAFLMLGLRAVMRAGFMADGIHHRKLVYDPTLSVMQNNMRVVEILGLPPDKVPPTLFFSGKEAHAADLLLAEHIPVRNGPVIAFVTQTSGGQPSRWFDDRFAAVADRVSDGHGAHIVFVGTKSEAGAIEAIRAHMKNPSASVAGRTSIAGLAALLSKCDLVVTLDTGTMHVARAVDVPVVVIAAAWQPAHEWLPLDSANIEIVRRNDIPCRSCRKFHCSTHECMDEISGDMVVSAIDKWLTRYPPSPPELQNRVANRLTEVSLGMD